MAGNRIEVAAIFESAERMQQDGRKKQGGPERFMCDKCDSAVTCEFNSSLNWEVLNYCLIVAKYNVFATSVRNGVLDFDSFLLRLNYKIDILHTIAFRSNRLPQLYLKKQGPNFFTYVTTSLLLPNCPSDPSA